MIYTQRIKSTTDKIKPINTTNPNTWNKLNDLGDIIDNLVFFVNKFDDTTNITISVEDFEPIVLTFKILKYIIDCVSKLFFK